MRVLWRHRLLTCVGGALALAAGVAIAQGPSVRIGVAQARVVLDTPASQLLDAEPLGPDTLPMRAAVLADLMASASLQPRIARRMRIAPEDLVVIAPHLLLLQQPTPLPERALEISAPTPEPYVLAIQATGQLPIIAIDASGPDRGESERLATAAIDTLTEAASAHLGTPDVQKFVIDIAGPVQSREVVSGPRKWKAGAAALFLFGLWCSCIMLASGVRRIRAESGRMPASAVNGY